MEIAGQFVLGQVIPLTIDWINRNVENSTARFWIALVMCFLIGFVASIGDVMVLVKDPSIPQLGKIFEAGLIIFTSSQIAYKNWYADSVIQAKIRYPLK